MSGHEHTDHEIIMAESTEVLHNNGNRITLVTEYRADGCVTWRHSGNRYTIHEKKVLGI